MKEFSSLKKLLSQVRRAVQTYDMIAPGDKIAVGYSGGKDSAALLCALKALSGFYPKKFEIFALCLDTGLPGQNLDCVKKLCEETETELILQKTDIYKTVFEIRKEKNPCSLCANLRRGALCEAAASRGINKVALGHHFDDVLETFFLSLFHEGRISCFSPVTYLDRTGITVIRPLIYTSESEIKHFVKAENLAVSPKNCPADGHTKREQMKNLIFRLEKENPGLKKRVYGALERGNVAGFKKCAPSMRTKGKTNKPIPEKQSRAGTVPAAERG